MAQKIYKSFSKAFGRVTAQTLQHDINQLQVDLQAMVKPQGFNNLTTTKSIWALVQQTGATAADLRDEHFLALHGLDKYNLNVRQVIDTLSITGRHRSNPVANRLRFAPKGSRSARA